VLLLAALALVALPAASFAQSAGDDQYQDPLAGGGGGKSAPSTPSTPSGGSNGSSSGSGTQGSSPAPAPSAAAAAAPSSGKTSRASANVPLAHTGFDAWVPGLAGALLLAGGIALLLAPRRQARRR
jgi:hypothetical protein